METKDNSGRKTPADSLDQALDAWMVEDVADGGFEEVVWCKIATRERPAWFPRLRDALLAPFGILSPQYATAVLAIALVGGVTAGQYFGGNPEREDYAVMSERYLDTIDPLSLADQP